LDGTPKRRFTYHNVGGAGSSHEKRINREIGEIGKERRREDWKIKKRWKGREGRERGLPYLLDLPV
jgi:hypothetical protein